MSEPRNDAEARRLFRKWDLELVHDLLPDGFELEAVTVSSHIDPLELLTLDEVSALIKRSRRQLTRDAAEGRLRTVKLGRSTRVPRAELERYIAAGAGYDDPPTIEEARRDH